MDSREGLTADELHVARHALGLPNARRRSYRNHFAAAHGSRPASVWRGLVARGLAIQSPDKSQYARFALTREGALAALLTGEKLDAEDFDLLPPGDTSNG